MSLQHFIAFDLGATSGRTVLGTLSDGELRIRELTRFPNRILPLGGHFYWNIFSLYEQLCEGLRAAAREGIEITSVGIDTWGVDFAFVGSDGSLLGMPYAYRDPHTEGAPAERYMPGPASRSCRSIRFTSYMLCTKKGLRNSLLPRSCFSCPMP